MEEGPHWSSVIPVMQPTPLQLLILGSASTEQRDLDCLTPEPIILGGLDPAVCWLESEAAVAAEAVPVSETVDAE